MKSWEEEKEVTTYRKSKRKELQKFINTFSTTALTAYNSNYWRALLYLIEKLLLNINKKNKLLKLTRAIALFLYTLLK